MENKFSANDALILLAEHNVIEDAQEWIGMRGKDGEDLEYINGVHDMAKKLMEVFADG